MTGFWKPFRVVLSLLSLLTISFIFLDFRQLLPSSWYNTFTFFQFIPSFRKFLILPGIISAGFIVITLITITFGRIYCSTICPLGIFQDVISRVVKRFQKMKRYKYTKPWNKLRYAILILTVIPLFFGSIYLLYLLDPYSNFGRLFSDLFKPLLNLINNVFAAILIKFNIYILSPFDVGKIQWLTLIYPILILGTVMFFSAKRGRLFCNTLCPVGTFLGFLSRYSFFRISIDKSNCTKCAKCSFVCKSQCINIKEQTVDVSRCVGCFNCLHTCEEKSITYRFSYGKNKFQPDGETSHDTSKRNFLLQGTLFSIGLSGLTQNVFARRNRHRNRLISTQKLHYTTPPGSISLDHFKNACTACHLCISACPSKVLQPSFLELGFTSMLQPYLDYHSNYCQYDCTKCSHVCPTGAILPISHAEKKTLQIGKVKFIKQNCVVFNDETSCGSCSEHCPTQAVAMVPYKGTLTIPEVDDTICIGCGACEYACPVRPYRAIYVEGNTIHKTALKPKTHKLEDTPSDSFPF